jgi:hypothetical protein
MTHDELLAKIDVKLEQCTCDGWNYNCFDDDNVPWLILRAVVELHKPSGIFCRGCGFIEEYNEPAQLLPCPTIQVIEKGLG